MFTGRNRNPRQRRSPTPGAPHSPGGANGPSRPPSPNLQTPNGKPLYLCSPFADAALVKGNFKTIVLLPKYVDIMEWVAVNSEFKCDGSSLTLTLPFLLIVFDFYTNLNEFYGVIAEHCTQHTCPTMSGGVRWVSLLLTIGHYEINSSITLA